MNMAAQFLQRFKSLREAWSCIDDTLSLSEGGERGRCNTLLPECPYESFPSAGNPESRETLIALYRADFSSAPEIADSPLPFSDAELGATVVYKPSGLVVRVDPIEWMEPTLVRAIELTVSRLENNRASESVRSRIRKQARF
jgi:hypothetical protein